MDDPGQRGGGERYAKLRPLDARRRRRGRGELSQSWPARLRLHSTGRGPPPNPGRTGAVHRLNRTEYNNAIRDLFALDVDVKPLLPGDETADGSFDNFADVLTISTAHLERYLSVARQVTRLATGLSPTSSGLETFEIPLHVVQDDRRAKTLPFGSRGGMAIRQVFPSTPSTSSKVRLRRQYQDYIMGMGWPAAARRPPGWQAADGSPLEDKPRAGPPRPVTPATANRALPAIPNGKSTCRSAVMQGWRFACRSRRGRTSSASRS